MYAYERPLIHCLHFNYERKSYARTHVKITRHWKSTLTCAAYCESLFLSGWAPFFLTRQKKSTTCARGTVKSA